MSATLRDAARDAFCETLRSVPANGPTLCEGWDAHLLAAHVWTLSYDPLAWLGMVGGPLGALTEHRLRRTTRHFPYPALVDRLATMHTFRCMPFDAREDFRHSMGEYVIHTEDVRRANGLTTPEPSPELSDALWRRLQVAAPQLHRPRPGLTLHRTDRPATYVVGKGEGAVVSGPSLELVLWVYGRRSAARVTVG